MAIAARADRPVSFQQWSAIAATPLDFRLDEGTYGLTLRATVWGTATLQRVLADGSGGQIAVDVTAGGVAGNGYAWFILPAGWYRLTLAGVTGLTGLIEKIKNGGR